MFFGNSIRKLTRFILGCSFAAVQGYNTFTAVFFKHYLNEFFGYGRNSFINANNASVNYSDYVICGDNVAVISRVTHRKRYRT